MPLCSTAVAPLAAGTRRLPASTDTRCFFGVAVEKLEPLPELSEVNGNWTPLTLHKKQELSEWMTRPISNTSPLPERIRLRLLAGLFHKHRISKSQRKGCRAPGQHAARSKLAPYVPATGFH